MRIETDFARAAASRRLAPPALAFALVLASFAFPPHAAALAAPPGAATALLERTQREAGKLAFERDSGSGAAIAFEEQSLPPEDLASPGPSPGALSAPPAGSQSPGGADNGGPGAKPPPAAGAAAQPPRAATVAQPPSQGGQQGAPDDEGTSGWTRAPAAAGGVGTSAAPGTSDAAGAGTGAPAEAAGAPVPGEPSPEATPTETPPPYDVGSIQPTAPVSDRPLTVLIASTLDQPALNASLRFAEQGRRALEASKLEDANRDLGRAISIDPTDPYAYFYLGRTYMAKKDYTQALAFFGRSEVGLRAVPAWLGEVKSFEGVCLEEQGKIPEASAAYKQALDVTPGNLMARAGYGRLSASLPDANAGGAGAAPPSNQGALVPAPQVNLAAPPPTEAAPLAAQPNSSDSSADSGDDSDTQDNGPGAQDDQ